MFYDITKSHYIKIVYFNSGYIRHYGLHSLLLCCDDIVNSSIHQQLVAKSQENLRFVNSFYDIVGCTILLTGLRIYTGAAGFVFACIDTQTS